MKSKLKNRIISCVVAALLVVGLLPVISVPANAATITPRTKEIDLTATSVIKQADSTSWGNPTTTNIDASIEGWKWYKSPADGYAANTFVMDGLNLTVNGEIALNLPSSSEIVVLSDSSVLNSASGINGAYAIMIRGDVTIDIAANASLTATGGGSISGSAGVMVPNAGNIVKKGAGTLNAVSGNGATGGYGVYAGVGFFVMLDGTVNATATGASGIGTYCADNAPIIYNGTLTSKGNTRAIATAPKTGTGATILGSTTYAGPPTTPITAAQAASTTYKNVQITATGGVIARSTSLDFSVNTVTLTYVSTTGSKTVNPTAGNITDSLEGWTWYKTPANDYAANTLVLDGLNMTFPLAYLYLPASSTILVTGDSTIRDTNTNASGSPIALGVFGELIIDVAAGVTLNVTGGFTSNGYSYSIMGRTFNGNIIKKGAGTLNTTGGDGPLGSYGIYANANDTFIMLDGTVNASGTGTSGIGTNCGSNAPIIYNGTLTSKGNSKAIAAAPIVGAGATILGSTTYAGTPAISITPTQAASTTYKSVQITATGGVIARTTALDFTVTSLTYVSTTGSKTVNPTSVNITDSLEGWTWYKSAADGYAANTLVLDGINLSTAAAKAMTMPAGATILLADGSTNTVTSTYTGGDTRGIYSVGALTIDGTGSLEARSGNISASSNGSSAININTGGLTIKGGEIRAIGGNSTDGAAFGILAHDGLTVTGGNITATAGNGSVTNNHGILVGSGDFTMTGGTINATTGTSSGARYGINVNSGSFTMLGGEITAKGPSGGNAMRVNSNVTGNIEILGNSGSVYDVPAQFNTASPKTIVTKSGGTAVLDARIAMHQYTITLDPEGGTGGTASVMAAQGDDLPSITAPTRAGYTFAGYYASPNGGGTQYYDADGSPLRVWEHADDATIYAKWTLITRVIEVTDETTDDSITVTANSDTLNAVFDRVVSASDLSGDSVVTLSLNISDIGGQTTETEAIKNAADKGSEVYFFDVTLTKQVNNDAPTTLTNIPVPVEVHIKLTDDLAGKAYYKVYRYHNNVAEQISNDTTKTEHYKVDIENSEIVIYTMKFSTYAIFGNDISLQDLTNGEDMDVQAKITDASIGVYKVDIAWGAMTFEWNSSATVYDPDTHEYVTNDTGEWTAASHNGENNRIVCANHSNGSLLATFDVSGTLGGVTYDVFTDNDVKDTAATDMSLPKVPNETATAPEIRAYLWLTGEPDGTAMAALSNIWQKVGVITITFTPDAGDTEKTPKN